MILILQVWIYKINLFSTLRFHVGLDLKWVPWLPRSQNLSYQIPSKSLSSSNIHEGRQFLIRSVLPAHPTLPHSHRLQLPGEGGPKQKYSLSVPLSVNSKVLYTWGSCQLSTSAASHLSPRPQPQSKSDPAHPNHGSGALAIWPKTDCLCPGEWRSGSSGHHSEGALKL